MARISNKVLLAYDDEPITDKYKDVDFTTNKIGGKPIWPREAPTAVTCKLCGLHLPLVLQLYAPLDASSFHRTLYIFACINPYCWNQNGSWVCLRSQVKTNDCEIESAKQPQIQQNDFGLNEWAGAGSDNWGDDEENGNIDFGDTSAFAGAVAAADITRDMQKMSVDERNANSCGPAEGAMGLLAASATIEGDEGEVVCIDTPTTPQVNLIAMLEETAPMPQVPNSNIQFAPYFINIWEEELTSPASPTISEHVHGLMENQFKQGDDINGLGRGCEENYEKSLPAHGDKSFFQFVSRIQANPGQLIRYGGHPLFLYPMHEKPKLCRHCGNELLFELQILPTLINKLHLLGSENRTHLEFGSVYLFSCAIACWDQRDSYREESLVVQMEKI